MDRNSCPQGSVVDPDRKTSTQRSCLQIQVDLTRVTQLVLGDKAYQYTHFSPRVDHGID